MGLSSGATIGLTVSLLVPIGFIVFYVFWYCLMSPNHAFMLRSRTPSSSASRLKKLRTRQRDLEAQVAADAGMDGTHGFEGLGSERDEGLERNARAILSTKEIRDREWRVAREKNGRPVGVGSPGVGTVEAKKATV
jgi:hypothetical protein